MCLASYIYHYIGLITDHKLSIYIKIHWLKAFAWSTLLYGCESWTLTAETHHSVGAAEMWTLSAETHRSVGAAEMWTLTAKTHRSVGAMEMWTLTAETHRSAGVMEMWFYKCMLRVFYVNWVTDEEAPRLIGMKEFLQTTNRRQLKLLGHIHDQKRGTRRT